MKLAQPFLSLPFRFDWDALEKEISCIPNSTWRSHPAGFAGNSFVRLISLEGRETDDRNGPMAPTSLLANCPIICGVLAKFETVIGATRLMRLAPGCGVPSHIDVSPYWAHRVRVHVPITTCPQAITYCEDHPLHMGAGEAWILDNWRRHHVENIGGSHRIHLVFDTVGSPAFWEMVGHLLPTPEKTTVTPASPDSLSLERPPRVTVATPEQVDSLIRDIQEELMIMRLTSPNETAPWLKLITDHRRAWRSTWMQHGPHESGWPYFNRLLKSLNLRALGIETDPLLPLNQFSTRKATLGRLMPTLDIPQLAPVESKTL